MKLRYGACVTALLLGVALGGCSGPASQGPPQPEVAADPPHLHAGDHWVYRMTDPRVGVATVTMRVVETNRTVLSGGRDVEATFIQVTQESEDGALQEVRQTLELGHDLAQIRILEESVHPADNRTTLLATMEFDAPCPRYPWPLRGGAEVASHCGLTMQATPGPAHSVVDVKAVVEAYEQVTVPAGTFDAFRLNVTNGSNGVVQSSQLHWWAPAACGAVRMVNRVGDRVATMELTSGHCAKPGAVRVIA